METFSTLKPWDHQSLGAMFDPDGHKLLNTLYATLFTWAITAVGASIVFLFKKPYRLVLDIGLGFAAGVMLSVTFWCILLPAIEMAEEDGNYKNFEFLPILIGLGLGAAFVLGVDLGIQKIAGDHHGKVHGENQESEAPTTPDEKGKREKSNAFDEPENMESNEEGSRDFFKNFSLKKLLQEKKFRRLILLVIAITVHNIPEGLAIGVSFGAVGESESATFEKARNFAAGVAFHSFPEGLAVSLPLRGMGIVPWKAFLWGQLSGVVEPIFGILGCLVVSSLNPILPYGLAFAAGTMLWVVLDDILPETRCNGNGKLANLAAIFGFILMMSLDLATHSHGHGDSHGDEHGGEVDDHAGHNHWRVSRMVENL